MPYLNGRKVSNEEWIAAKSGEPVGWMEVAGYKYGDDVPEPEEEQPPAPEPPKKRRGRARTAQAEAAIAEAVGLDISLDGDNEPETQEPNDGATDEEGQAVE